MSANGNQFYFDYQNGQYGYNTDPARGADTFSPFKSGIQAVIHGRKQTNGWTAVHAGKVSVQVLDNTFSASDGYTYTINLYVNDKVVDTYAVQLTGGDDRYPFHLFDVYLYEGDKIYLSCALSNSNARNYHLYAVIV